MADDKLCLQTEDGEMIDPQTKLRERCQAKKECCDMMGKLTECNDRVNSKTKTAETCVEEMLDWMHCVDHCVSKKLFNYLK